MKKTLLIIGLVIVSLCKIYAQPTLWGGTLEGGSNTIGVIFQYNPATSTYTKILDFNGSQMGAKLSGSLMQATNGKIYGMSHQGGIFGHGIIFEIEPFTNSFSKKFEFDRITNGERPYGSLMQAANGKLYGMAHYGGANNLGVLFEFEPSTNVFTKILDFDSSSNGSNPVGDLMQASNGKLYGMTKNGGALNFGILFELDPNTKNFTKIIDFDGSAHGRYPIGSLMQASNGKIYGLTAQGGNNDMGLLFEYDINTSTLLSKFSFDGASSGLAPHGSLIQSTNGKLYGLTTFGGVMNNGVLFEFDFTNNTCVKKVDFDNVTKGRSPLGSLTQASNGKLYGMTSQGGVFDFGVLFEFDPITNNLTKKLDFADSTNGKNPTYTKLLEINLEPNSVIQKVLSENRPLVYIDEYNQIKANITSFAESITELEVYDLSGRAVLQAQNLSGKQAIVDASMLHNGIYIVRVNTDAGTVSTKLMISH